MRLLMITYLTMDSEKEVRHFLLSRLKAHKMWILYSALFAAVSATLTVRTAALVKPLIDDAIIPQNWRRVVILCLTLVGLVFLDNAADFLHRFLLRIGVERFVRNLRNEIFNRFLIFSQAQLKYFDAGRAVTNIVQDVYSVSLGLYIVADLIREPLVIIGLLIYLFSLNWKLTVVCMVALPTIAIVSKKLGGSARRNQGRIQNSLERISTHTVESMGGLRTAHAYGQIQQLRDEFNSKTADSYKFLVRMARTEEMVAPLTKWVTSWIGGLLIAYGSYLVVKGQLSPGGLVSFITAAALLQQPLRQLNQVNVRLQQVLASALRVYRSLVEPLDDVARAQEAILQKDSPLFKPTSTPLLSFKNVSFQYALHRDGHDERGLALENIHLQIEPGKKIALVGASGSGKSTLSLLAMRFLDPTSGTIELNNKNAKEYDLSEYRSYFAYVSQDVFLFNRSIRDNLKFARPQASDEEIYKALEQASLLEFVKGLPQKLDTLVGIHGANISGGEKQRLAIARCFLKDAPILILDEATAHLDAQNEAAVQEAIVQLVRGRSVLVIAHRLATIRNADEVFVLSKGHILEQGSPLTLMQNSGSAFSKLWQSQHAL